MFNFEFSILNSEKTCLTFNEHLLTLLLRMARFRYDLEERTLAFGKEVITLLKKEKRTELNGNIRDQLLRSATSIGANYHEANGAQSRKDFLHKVSLVRKEIKETRYWLNLLRVLTAYPREIEKLLSELDEIERIFGKIHSSLQKRK